MHPTEKVFDRNSKVQLLTVYTNPERHDAQRHRRADRQTALRCQEPIILRPVRSAKNCGVVLRVCHPSARCHWAAYSIIPTVQYCYMWYECDTERYEASV